METLEIHQKRMLHGFFNKNAKLRVSPIETMNFICYRFTFYFDKAKPVEKQRRKATGLNDSRVASEVAWLFLIYEEENQ